ncbi:ArnT family glycosyltransferase [Celerinatantimonas diazotrophica]|uniref:ArnT family glycosyltransferase n=1 Tax=Celerinatantimonas diazotrophica TaxID=412034 RepID=UPI001404D793|nr:phospholipid carrier-dependent glycosyltransferase [Celerinatantimonas diazotrophica]
MTIISVVWVPLFPIDQTRYISVAWEMYLNHNYLVPHLNGSAYPDKPPMLFWLINLIWSFFGHSNILTRMIIPFFSLLNLGVVCLLHREIYPSKNILTPLILFSFAGWLTYSSLTMFDLLLTLFIQLAMWMSFQYFATHKKRWTILTGICIGLALLTKGPVAWVFMIGFFICLKLFKLKEEKTANAIRFFLITILISIGIILLWAIPAAIVGGEHYADAIFWKQSAGRIAHSFAHQRPFYWYLLVLPGLLFPFVFFKSFWLNKPWKIKHPSDLFCLTLIGITVFVFSCFSGKQIHYLFPIFPIIAIWLSEQLEAPKQAIEPITIITFAITIIAILTSFLWGGYLLPQIKFSIGNNLLIVIVLSLLLWLFIFNKQPLYTYKLNLVSLPICFAGALIAFSPILYKFYDVTPEAKIIAKLQSRQKTISYVGKYPDTFAFLGRLKKPIVVKNNSKKTLNHYLQSNPGYTVWISNDDVPHLKEQATYASRYRGKWLYILQNQLLYKYLKQQDHGHHKELS